MDIQAYADKPALSIDYFFNLTIGSLVMYSLLFILCIYAYCSRPSKNINSTLHFTLATSIFGVLSSALQLGIQSSSLSHSGAIKTLVTGIFFSMTLVPLTWMVGIRLFAVLLKDRESRLMLILSYLLTLIQFGLAIALATYLVGPILGYNEFSHRSEIKTCNDLFISITCLNWGFLLLFFLLMIQQKSSIPRSIIITVIIFGVLNAVRLITETAMLRSDAQLSVEALHYIRFFFTDFMTCISLYITTIFWKNVQKTINNQQLVEK